METERGVPQDYQLALKWHKLAVEKGDAEAQFKTGVLYENGIGLPKDIQLAAKWFRRAAEQGDTDAQFKTGVNYANGIGVPKDYALAYKWFNLAAAKGVKKASKWRDELAKKMTPSQIQEAQKLARNFKPKKEKPKK